jgi:purine-cytosine permease-like protein
MRWKLLLISTLVATIAGVGATLGIICCIFGSARSLTKPDLPVFLTFIIPLATVGLSSFFVYRHTARRRALQAIVTALLAGLLTLTLLILSSLLLAKRSPSSMPVPAPRNVG